MDPRRPVKSLAANGFSVSIRESRWWGDEADPLPLYGSYKTQTTGGEDALGYVVVWDKLVRPDQSYIQYLSA